jgi:hypothetical protein
MTSSRHVAIACVVLGGCTWGGGPGPGPSGRLADSGVADMKKADSMMTADARPADAAIDTPPPPPAQHLLMTELALAPDGAELIEIYNPTTNTIDLKDYYLSNHGSYFKLPVAGQSIPYAHFIVRFPQTASIMAGQVIVVATQGAAPFMAFHGVMPTYSITDGTMTAVEVNGTPRLTDGGASVILFRWDGASGLVGDVDIMVAGAPSLTNTLINKSGVMQNGMTYATDANTIQPQAAAPGIDQSTKRIKREDGQEANGGNGIAGHDETSEHTEITWDTQFGAPTPGAVPATL